MCEFLEDMERDDETNEKKASFVSIEGKLTEVALYQIPADLAQASTYFWLAHDN